MIVNAFSEVVSLNTAPEDYTIEYTLEPHETPEAAYLALSELLTFKLKKGKYCSTLPDFIINKEKLKVALNLTPKAFDVCKSYILQLKELDEIRHGSINDQIHTTLKNQLKSDQKAAVAFMLARRKAINASSVGIGKTITALGCFNVLRNQNQIVSGVVFVLYENKLSWYDEILKHTDYKYSIVRNGSEKVIKDIEAFDGDLLVVHYDCLLNPEVRLALIQQHFDFWIVDEAHILRNGEKKKKNKKSKQYEPTCQRASALYEICETTKPNYIYALTGTPVSQSPMNAFGIFRLIKPNLIPDRTAFEDHFCNFIQIPVKKGSKIKIKILNKSKPYKNLDELRKLMDLVTYRQTHNDCGDDFPPTIFVPKKVQMESDQAMLYQRIKEATFKEIANHPEKALNLDYVMVKTIRLRQCLSTPEILGEKASSIKFKVLDQMLEEILEDPAAKIVVFSPHRPTLDLLVNKYKDKYKAGLFAGIDENLSAEKRDFNIHTFIAGDSRVLFSNTSKAVGQNWGIARVSIFLDLPIVSIDFLQSVGRITRRDSKGTSVIIPVLIEGSFDEYAWECLEERQKHAGEIIEQDEIVIDKDKLLKAL